MEQSNEQKFYDILKSFRNAMLVTHAGNTLRARPMAIAQVQPSCEMWFMTDAECAKTHEIMSDTRVLVTCQNDSSSYISVNGTASVVLNRAKINELWQEPYAVFFPKGKNDPNIALIQFKPQDGEYWDGGGLNKVKYLYEAAKAYATGEKIHVKEGEQHGFVKL